MTVHIEDVLLWAMAQDDYPYVWGGDSAAEGGFDCSGLVYAACNAAGVTPAVPRTAYLQWRHCKQHGTLIPVAQALATRGAQLWVGDGTGTGRDAITHVAFSLGDGTGTYTFEARGKAWGIGSWPAGHRFQYGGLLPGVDYSPGHGRFPEEDDMPTADEVATAVVNRLNTEGTANGLLSFGATTVEGVNLGRANYNLLQALAKKIGDIRPADIDEQALAGAVLSGLSADVIAAAIPDAVATAVVNQLRDRLAS